MGIMGCGTSLRALLIDEFVAVHHLFDYPHKMSFPKQYKF